ncbi:c-type cytochrome [Sulfurimonas sp.]
MKKLALLALLLSSLVIAEQSDGKKIFETYCWGCHHQTAMAFGPPFNQIASKRSKGEIMAYIASPSSMYKKFGYKRSVMTQLHLSPKELDTISDYILSYKGKK